jgi:hypothetical protein
MRSFGKTELDGYSWRSWLVGDSHTAETSKEEKEDMRMKAVIQRQTIYAGSSNKILCNFSLYCELYIT